nr:TadE family protein [Bariatricus massiliensis]
MVKKGDLRGSTVVEAAYLFPMIMLVWMLVLFALFYYHDKNILAGASYETAVVGSEIAHEGEVPEGKLAQYFQERIKGKLIFFGGASISVNSGKNGIEVKVKARARNMALTVNKSAAITEPEKLIRKFRIARQRLEEIDK